MQINPNIPNLKSITDNVKNRIIKIHDHFICECFFIFIPLPLGGILQKKDTEVNTMENSRKIKLLSFFS